MLIEKSNQKLQKDLIAGWADNHLTAQHAIVISRCNGCEASPGPHSSLFVFKNAEPYDPNEKLKAFGEYIAENYVFDNLVVRSCCHNCGTVLFRRSIGGVVYDRMLDDQGLIDVIPTSGIDEDDLSSPTRVN